MEARFDFSDDVVLLVGETAKRIVVHENILCSSSEFFKAAAASPWKELVEKMIALPEIAENVFMIYVSWLYVDGLDVFDSSKHNDLAAASDHSEAAQSSFRNILESYILGDFLGDKKFPNSLLDKLIEVSETTQKLPSPSTIMEYWLRLPERSSIRRPLVDLEVCYCEVKSFEDQAKGWPIEFLMDVAKACMEDRPRDRNGRCPETRDTCYYHQHRGESDKCSKPTKQGHSQCGHHG